MKKDVFPLRKILAPVLILSHLFFQPASIYGACEAACADIADDETAFSRITDQINGIETEMNSIREWQADPVTNLNALSQAVNRKTQDANTLREILTDYFLYQRIPVPEKNRGSEYESYTQNLVLIHSLLNQTAAIKDTAEAAAIDSLRAKLEEFRSAYYGKSSFQLGQLTSQSSVVTVSE